MTDRVAKAKVPSKSIASQSFLESTGELAMAEATNATKKVTGKRKSLESNGLKDVRTTKRVKSPGRLQNGPGPKSKPPKSEVLKHTNFQENSTERTNIMPVTRKVVGKQTDVKYEETRATPKTTVKKAAAPKSARAKATTNKSSKREPEVNQPPSEVLHVYVFGEGSQGELGLGSKNEPGRAVIDVKYPRLNLKLEVLDIVQIAVGGMHCAALTADNRIFTWGVNDQGALGRNTADEGKMRDIASIQDDDSDSDAESEDSGLNLSEAEPRQVDPNHFPEGTRFSSLFAGDSTTFALTTTGRVYGWGTFRGNDGVLGFNKESMSKDGRKMQSIPMLIPELKQVKLMAIGTNHALALTHKGKAFVWGAGEQSQLGRRVVARTAAGALVPREFGFQKKEIVNIATGDYFSYAIEKNGDVYAWGHNGYGQTGITTESNFDDIIPVPTLVESLKGRGIIQLAGGNHHTIARTKECEVLVWGRLDNHEGGMKFEDMPQDALVRDPRSKRVLASTKPISLPNLKARHVATGTDTCFVITEDGKAYSWGFSTNYQTGLGTSDDVVEATLLDNTAVRGKKLNFAGIGGQFGVLTSVKD